MILPQWFCQNRINILPQWLQWGDINETELLTSLVQSGVFQVWEMWVKR